MGELQENENSDMQGKSDIQKNAIIQRYSNIMGSNSDE
jgi:hypothetical protein